MKRLLLFCLLASLPAFGQAYSSSVLQNSPGNYGRPVPFASVMVCSITDTGTPCTSRVTTYTDFTLTTACTVSSGSGVLTGAPTSGTGCNNPGTADANGNFTFYVPTGQYRFCSYAGGWICQNTSVGGSLALTGQVGSVCYLTLTPLTCDPSITTNGSGALTALTGTFNSVTTGGSGAGTWTATEGTGIPNPSAGKDTIYVDSGTHAISCKNSAGAQCPPNPAVSVKPVTGDEIQYISTNANDSSDGFSWGTGKATWAATKTFCSTHNCLVAFSPGISTTDCPDGTATILTVDYRSLTTPCGNNAVSWNTQGSGSSISRSLLRLGLLYSAPSSSSAAGIGFADYTGNLTSANGQSLEGLNGTSFMTGTLTNVPGSIFVNGFEGSAEVQTSGAGVTLPDVRGMTANITLLTGNTSSVTKASSVYGQACSVAGTGTIANCVSGYFEQPTAGTAVNESLHADGESSFGGPPGSARVYTDRLGSGDLQTTAVAFATLTGAITCNSTNEGAEKAVNDSTVNTVGSTISGSGSNHVKAYCNGSNWVVGEGGTGGGSSTPVPLNISGPQSAITGTGAAASVYSYTMPGNTLPSSGCIRVLVGFKHTTGSASVTYTFLFGGSTVTGIASTATALGQARLQVCNNASTSSQFIMSTDWLVGSTAFSPTQRTSSENTTGSLTVAFQFNVANTDAVTPEFWTVEAF